jgi:hypothetical protein
MTSYSSAWVCVSCGRVVRTLATKSVSRGHRLEGAGIGSLAFTGSMLTVFRLISVNVALVIGLTRVYWPVWHLC